MADTESILRLGIEAARAGDKEEARNLFRLLTREKPDDPQAWLWLAGVAEDSEEKRAALEHALALDPTNELARKGLQALGASPAAPQESRPFDTRPLADIHEPAEQQADPFTPSMPQAETRAASADEELASSLDSIGVYDTYQRGDRSREDSYTIPDFGDEETDIQSYMDRPRVRPEDIELDEPVEEEPRSRNLRPIVGVIAVAALIAVILLLVLGGNDDDQQPNGGGGNGGGAAVVDPTAAGQQPGPTDPAAGGAGATEPAPEQTPAGQGAGTEPTAAPGGEQPTAAPGGEQPTAAPGGEQPTAAPAPQPAGDLANANPQPVGANTPIQSGALTYNFPDASYSIVIPGPVGGLQPQNGRWVVALVIVSSSSGQPLDPNYFVAKDGEGRVYQANPDASEAYLNRFGRGVAADQSMKDPLPPNINVSVPLLFDVHGGATNLVIFTTENQGQGYLLQSNVP